MMGNGSITQSLRPDEVKQLVLDGLSVLLEGRANTLFIIPDSTRSMPLPFVFPIINQVARQTGCHIDTLIALGTHPPLTVTEIENLLGIPDMEDYQEKSGSRIWNHDWKNEKNLARIGIIEPDEVTVLTDGLLGNPIPVEINKLIESYEQLIICGPVFPHEVAGFSGGNKYLFPGIAGEKIIHMTHWLGALSTSLETIGKLDTPVRRIINRASVFIKVPVKHMAFCIKDDAVFGLYIGDMDETWGEAAKLSARLNVIQVPQKYQSVLSIPSKKYNELWTAAKAMYKLEPIVADGGEVIIYAPHLEEISLTHGTYIRKLGYHVRDYFTKQWDIYRNFPWAVLAHSTHLKGSGIYENGIESPRINVRLATGIPRDLCEEINLDYVDPNSIHFDEWGGKEKLIVRNAGEILYKPVT